MLLETTVLVSSLMALAVLLRLTASGRGLGISRWATVSAGISTAAIAISLVLRLIQAGSDWSEARKLVVTLAIGTLSGCSIFLWRSLRPRRAADRR